MLLLAVTIWHSKFHIGYKKKMNIQNTKSPFTHPFSNPTFIWKYGKSRIYSTRKMARDTQAGIFSKGGKAEIEREGGSQGRDWFSTLINYTDRSNLQLNSQQKPAVSNQSFANDDHFKQLFDILLRVPFEV